jgi:hypothetical protein
MHVGSTLILSLKLSLCDMQGCEMGPTYTYIMYPVQTSKPCNESNRLLCSSIRLGYTANAMRRARPRTHTDTWPAEARTHTHTHTHTQEFETHTHTHTHAFEERTQRVARCRPEDCDLVVELHHLPVRPLPRPLDRGFEVHRSKEVLTPRMKDQFPVHGEH